LNEFGVLVTEADNGEKAIKEINRNAFDLILMDIKMPGLNGYETTKLIRNKLKLITPIIAFTANVIKGEIEKCLEAGMNDYLAKPIERDQFLKTISHWLNTSEKNIIPVAENKTQLPLFDLSRLEEIAKGDQQFVNKMVKLFISEATSSVAQIKIAYQDGDFSKVKAIAHRIKPSIDNMGISSLKNDIREIENQAELYQPSKQLDTLITHLATKITLVINDLKNFMN
jgi:CheY-like chemotaxis protein/HPt (histidine-containing phosphotransfer) domain-containing protein